MSDETVYELFRFDNPDGSTKDWAIAVAPPGLRIRYCKTGSAARLSEVPWAKYPGRTAEREMQDRIDKKLAKGYYKVSEADIFDDRLRECSRVPMHDLHWEVISPLEIGPLSVALAKLSRKLSDGVSCQLVNQFDNDSGIANVKVLICTGLDVNLLHRRWQFGQQDGGGLDRVGRGGGRVSVHFGPVPFLILMALEREFPGKFQFANDDGSAVMPCIAENDEFFDAMNASMAEIVEIGAKLGLCLGPIRLSESTDESAEQTLWF